MKSKIVHSRQSDEWETPQWLFDELNSIFNFDCDLAASEDNYKCDTYYTKDIFDPITSIFPFTVHKSIFCNPPYSRIKDFLGCLKRSFEFDKQIKSVWLLPARTCTKWFHEIVLPHAHYIGFIKGRLKFGNSINSAPFPSIIVVFDLNKNYANPLHLKQRIQTFDLLTLAVLYNKFI